MIFAMGDDLSYGLNTLGPLCLWQCFKKKDESFEDEVAVSRKIVNHLPTGNFNSVHARTPKKNSVWGK